MQVGGRSLISSRKVIQTLKKNHSLPDWVDEFAQIPPDPDKKFIMVHVKRKFMVPSSFYSQTLDQKETSTMNYEDMIEAIKEGKKATRPSWQEGEFVFSKDDILVHTSPYWPEETLNEKLQGYPYVVELQDVCASDWLLCG